MSAVWLSTALTLHPYMYTHTTTVHETQIKKVTIRTYGGKLISIESANARKVLQAQVLNGLVAYVPGNATVPSLINAPFLASELGIECSIDDKVHQSMVSCDSHIGDAPNCTLQILSTALFYENL
jgi:hypothetical protein